MLTGVDLVRHAPTKANSPGAEVIRGWSELPVHPDGKMVAVKRAQFFRDKPVSKIYTTPLLRGLVMAHAIEAVTLAPVIPEHALLSWNMGKFQGKPAGAANAELNKYMLETPEKNVPDGESFATFEARFLSFLKAHMADVNAVLVTHFRNIVLAKAWIDGRGVPSGATLKNGRPLDSVGIAQVRPGAFVVLDRDPMPQS